MKKLTKALVSIFCVLSLCAEVALASQVKIFHWWVSDGEQASIRIIQQYVQEEGLIWSEQAIAGSGTAQFGDVLKEWVDRGEPPTASQVIGYDIHHWARQGKLINLDDIAQEQEWDEVVPYGIQHLSKYQGGWYAVPFNTHSTNWIWLNSDHYRHLGSIAPDTWDELLNMLDIAHSMGIIPIAIGRDSWEHTLLFEVVAAGVGGAEFYRRAFLDLEPDSLDNDILLTIFRRMRQLSAYIDPQFDQRSWNEATQLVLSGQALMQVQGSWVNGEFTYHGYTPGKEFECLRFPDTQGIFLFNSDQYMFFKDGVGDPVSRRKLSSILMDTELQRDVNISSGAAPARVDVAREGFNECGRNAISDMRSANMRRTLMGSIAMGNANPPEIKESIYAVVSDHLHNRISDEQAVVLLRQALTGSSSQELTQ